MSIEAVCGMSASQSGNPSSNLCVEVEKFKCCAHAPRMLPSRCIRTDEETRMSLTGGSGPSDNLLDSHICVLLAKMSENCCMLFGNLYIYLDWNGRTEIPDSSRKNIFLSLLVASIVGTLSFLVLRRTHQPEEEMLSEEEGQSLLATRAVYKHRANTALQEVKDDFKTMLELLKTRNILLLSPCMAYSGLELSFYSGVYGTCLGATAQFGQAAKGLIGISGMVLGVGEIIGGGLFGLVCKNNRFRRTSVVFLGMVVHFVAFYLIFLNIPEDAPLVFSTATTKSPFLTPSVSVALLCSFLLGLGDSCFNTQLYSILGSVYAEQSTPAFAIFKFIQSIFAAVAFFYSGDTLLTWQLLLMVVLGFSGTLCFFVAERMHDVDVASTGALE
ncbi:UNC93-like protein MFSD11 isoform X2 [Phycodurus eques]|uniref:UNC93-like protein MFSD11 isoform X2 n=1 Tax=Phycodurus eques TaxID=693459 RepID=UPI002ACD2CE1|nr:UNC93-like protein MFSD11 isoform X2 [Phycodurus eques]